MKDIQVVHVDPLTRRVSIKMGDPPRVVTGLSKLIQVVVLALLNDPGRNVFAPSGGSGLPSLIGSNISSGDPSEGIALVTERIEKVKTEILENQTALENELSSERLSDLQVLSVDTGVNIDEIIVKLKLISEDGQEVTLAI